MWYLCFLVLKGSETEVLGSDCRCLYYPLNHWGTVTTIYLVYLFNKPGIAVLVKMSSWRHYLVLCRASECWTSADSTFKHTPVSSSFSAPSSSVSERHCEDESQRDTDLLLIWSSSLVYLWRDTCWQDLLLPQSCPFSTFVSNCRLDFSIS